MWVVKGGLQGSNLDFGRAVEDIEKSSTIKKILNNFWRTLEIPWINWEINLIPTWSADCVISAATGVTPLAITDTEYYVPVVTMSTQYNIKLIEELKLGFKWKINWNKHQSYVDQISQIPYINDLTDPRFQGVNRHFVLCYDLTE